MKVDELTKLSDELEEKIKDAPVDSTRDEDDEAGFKALLHKSMDIIKTLIPRVEVEEEEEDLSKSEKAKDDDGDDDDDEDAEEDEKGRKKSKRAKGMKKAIEGAEKSGETSTYQALVASDVGKDLEEMVDATPVLAEVIDVVAKSQGQVQAIYESLTRQDERIDALMQANAALCKGFEALYTSVMSQPRRATSPGFVMVPNNEKTPQVADLRAKVTKAIMDHKIESYVLSWFDTRTEEQIIAALPEGVLD